ncbi:hypothetical protein VIBHAR_p08225 (plasmid) [Vibrio campbellii ATCC BAA-1116]|uniref:Uncharacterized protein n=1 Tax=Vibrio campbellii (strain ATCC BAA-1116) TaxID=2902295 RepID=A7N8T6_VIBC1|nr:hypothetical protein VIBHAR_p08225 [Vibrio campbellii ATCC BAA-1116]
MCCEDVSCSLRERILIFFAQLRMCDAVTWFKDKGNDRKQK